MSSEIRETTFRLMVKARVFHRKADGVITQMFIDESGVGYTPDDRLSHWEKAFVRKNADPLMLAAVMCLLGIANAKTEEERAKAAHVVFPTDAAADTQAAEAAHKLAQKVIDEAEGGLPSVIEPKKLPEDPEKKP